MKSFSGSPMKSKGFSLLELLIAAALIAVGLLGLFFLVNRYNVQQAVANEVQALSQTVAETRTKFRAPGNFAGITPTVLIDNGMINPSRVVAGTIMSEWSTVVGVVPVNLNGTVNDAVSFNYTVPRQFCSDFVSGVAGIPSFALRPIRSAKFGGFRSM